MEKVFRSLFFLIFCSVILNANECINIEEQYFKRSQQYPINGYKKIMVFSPYRTGSTLVFNVLRFLFEDSEFLDKIAWGHHNSIVAKTHALGYMDPSIIVFCLIRNPIDTCFSRYRVMMSQASAQGISPESFQEFEEESLDMAVQDYLTQMQWMYDLLNKRVRNVVLLKYEDFNSNLEFIFAKFEKVFNIKICEMDRLLMEELFSKENIALNIKSLQNFQNFNEITLFHGAHIDANEFSEEEKAIIHAKIRERLSRKCSNFLGKILRQYGYNW